MRGDLYDGWATIAGDFPPSVNTDSDPTKLKPFESPSCYGVDCQATGYLKTGSVLTGTARTAPTATVATNAYNLYYDRLWRASTTSLIYGAKYYDDVYAIQGKGSVKASANIVTFMPAFSNDLWVVTATGSHILGSAISGEGQFRLGQFFQEAYVSTASHATTANGVPHFANVDGVFSWNGQSLKELTRPVRTSLGVFVGAALTLDYSERFLIGGTAYVIDLESEKLFDYTAGFKFTTRTLSSKDYRPFQMDGVSFDVKYTGAGNDLIQWETKVDDGNWYQEEPITMQGEDGKTSRFEVPISNGSRNGRKFAIRLTALPSFVSIRDISVMVREFAQETPSE